MDAYTDSGVIGYPSYGTAGEAKAVLATLKETFAEGLEALGERADDEEGAAR
ncbi:hypothetical protein ACH4UM_06645 [Streptomyces sp. NPDC020801]|uniref:hypothetical protein n=1 Tax=Streptomyces sp. NPDC020801 TaxID=3365093 RepID=UPI00379E9EDE